MNAGSTLSVDAETPGCEPSATAAWSHRDHAAQPAKPLGPKASQLQVRRQQRGAPRADARAMPRQAPPLTTADGAVTFVLKASGDALYIERIQRRPLGTHVVQCMVFGSASEFARWCNAEPLRLDDPGLHRRLCRRGLEVFGGGA